MEFLPSKPTPCVSPFAARRCPPEGELRQLPHRTLSDRLRGGVHHRRQAIRFTAISDVVSVEVREVVEKRRAGNRSPVRRRGDVVPVEDVEDELLAVLQDIGDVPVVPAGGVGVGRNLG